MIANDLSARLANTGQLLVRSGIEIGKLLDAILLDRDTLTANVPPKIMFMSQLLRVEPIRGTMMISFSDHKPANSAALSSPKLSLRCSHRGALFAFSADAPRQAVHEGQACIQCVLPTAVLGMQQRRGQSRVQVPAQAPVGAELRMGLQAFRARVADVSLDGICMLVSDPTIPLCEGTRLERVRIRHPQVEDFEVDLEVRHVARVVLASGERASRLGCRVLGSREVLEDLIRLFVIDLA
ncbi:MAG: flagellar brake protein [Burkholderiales bacterium]